MQWEGYPKLSFKRRLRLALSNMLILTGWLLYLRKLAREEQQ
jgi:hypothetical protein